jgi:hypothetical protein
VNPSELITNNLGLVSGAVLAASSRIFEDIYGSGPGDANGSNQGSSTSALATGNFSWPEEGGLAKIENTVAPPKEWPARNTSSEHRIRDAVQLDQSMSDLSCVIIVLEFDFMSATGVIESWDINE